MLDVVAALEHIDLGERDDVYHAIRGLLVHRHDQMATFDRAFVAFWREHHNDEPVRTVTTEESRASIVEIDQLLVPNDPAGSIQGRDNDAQSSDDGLKTWSDSGGLAD